jgi:hypothetical protein
MVIKTKNNKNEIFRMLSQESRFFFKLVRVTKGELSRAVIKPMTVRQL